MARAGKCACAMIAAVLCTGADSRSEPVLLRKTGPVRSDSISIPDLKTGVTYAVLFFVNSARPFGGDARIDIHLRQGAAELVHKTLHIDDRSLFATFHVPKNGSAELRVEVLGKLSGPATYVLQVNRWSGAPPAEQRQKGKWQDSNHVARYDRVSVRASS